MPHRLLVLLASTVVLAAASAAGADPISLKSSSTPAQQMFEQGRNALAAGQLDTAHAAFERSLQLDGRAVGALLGLAQVAARRGDGQSVAAYLEKAYALAPENAEVQVNWGAWQYSKGQVGQAKSAYEKAVSIEPSNTLARVSLGELYMMAFNNPGEAIPHYRNAIKSDPTRAGARYALGVALVRVGQLAEAESELREAARLSPSNPLPWLELGNLQEAQRRPDQALTSYAASAKADPRSAMGHLATGNLLMALGRNEEAAQAFQRVLQVEPKLADAYVKLGMTRQLQRRWDDAERAYLAAIELAPQHAIAYNNLAWMTAERRADLVRGRQWAQRAIDLAPGVAQFHDTLGWVARVSRDLKGAEAALRKAASIAPPDPETIYHLGVVLDEQGRKADAAAQFRRALSLSPKFAGADDARRRLESQP